MLRSLQVVASLLVAASLIGCGDQDDGRPARVDATATIRYQGQPVEGATVTFVPEQEGGKAAFGTTDASGTATLGTFRAADGAMPGSYVVTVSKIEIEELSTKDRHGMLEVRDKHLVPEKYGDAETSGLTVTVSESGMNEFTFDLTD